MIMSISVDHVKKYMPTVSKKHDFVVEGNVKLVNTLELDYEVLCLRFNDTGKLLAIGLTNGNIMVYCVESKGFSYVLKRAGKSNVPVTSLKWKPESSDQLYGFMLMATYVTGEVMTWHVTSGKCMKVYREDCQFLTAAYNSSGTQLAAGGSNGNIYVYDEVIGEKIATLGASVKGEVMDGHVMRVFALQYNPLDDNVFVSGGWDNTVQWWDTRVSNNYSIKKISGPHICGEGLDVERSTQNVVASSWRKYKNLEVYDFGSGKLMKDIPAYSNLTMLYCAQWKDRSSIIVGGSHNHMMSLVDYSSSMTIGSVLNLSGGVCAMDNTRIGNHPKIAAATKKSVLIISDDV